MAKSDVRDENVLPTKRVKALEERLVTRLLPLEIPIGVKDEVRPRRGFVASNTCCEADVPGAPAARSPFNGPPGVPRDRSTTKASAAASVAAMASRRRELLGGKISTRCGTGRAIGARK